MNTKLFQTIGLVLLVLGIVVSPLLGNFIPANVNQILIYVGLLLNVVGFVADKKAA